MQGKAFVVGLGKYLKHLLQTILLPLVLLNLFKTAKRHQEDDTRAVPKYVASVVVGLLLFGAVGSYFVGFHEDQVDGIYANLDSSLSRITGNAAYEEGVKTQDEAAIAANQEGHDFYLVISELVASRDDAAGRQLLENSEAFGEAGLTAYDKKDKGVADVQQFMWLFVYPGILGVFFAPIVFTMGNVVNKSWTPSESVGFKPYPATSGALFLLLGAFGIPALFFGAWALMDVQDRSKEGQISL